MSRITALAVTFALGFACAPQPPDADVETFADGATLCMQGDELRAVFDTCGSSCDLVEEASCSVEEGAIATVYTVGTVEGDCDTACRLVDAGCGDPEDAALSYGADEVTLADLPDCGSVF